MLELNLDDPFLAALFRRVFLILTLLLVIPGVFALVLALNNLNSNVESEWMLWSYKNLRATRAATPVEVSTYLAYVFPALIAALAFRREGTLEHLTSAGKAAVMVLLTGIPIGLLGLILSHQIEPRNIDGGLETIEMLMEASDLTLRLSATNLALILGIRWPSREAEKSD